jgi:serine/threonine protein kinase
MEIYMNELNTESPYELSKDLKFIKEIDHGAFGNVIQVLETKKNLDFAIKVINKIGASTQLIKEMKEEISILKKINHNNIVKFYGYHETNNQLLIKMEYIKYGTLSNWMKNHHKISEDEASIIVGRVLSAVEYLHSMQICHRDIKPENIMISKENDLSSIKIIDFGLSAQQFNYLSNNEYCGTLLYMAPEQIEKKLYYFSVDIWSIGILMYMLLNNGKHPFYQKGDKKEDFINKIKSGKLNFINKISFMAKHLNHKLCEPNPSWRYSANLAIKHPWITRNPNDEIPLTFNEILSRNNSRKNANCLMMISIFLNYYKKKEVQKRNNGNNLYNFEIFINRKKAKNKIYKINTEYINKCIIISKKEKEKQLKIKEKCLEVLSTDEEESFEKIKTINNNIISKQSLKKSLKNLVKFVSPPKKYYLQEANNELQNDLNKKFHKNNLLLSNNNSETINQNNNKSYKKEKSKLYLSSVPSNEYKHQKSDEIKRNNKLKNNLNTNKKNQINYTNRNRAKSKSISKFYIEKSNSNNENEVKGALSPERSSKVLLKLNPKSNLPYVLDNNINHVNINLTNKKYHNNYIGNYNIIPLVLPFIGGKQEKKNIVI